MVHTQFVDKAGSGGHNKKASLELQSRLCRGFTHNTRARVAELADALASGASDRKVVEVRVLSRAPLKQQYPGSFPNLFRFKRPYWIQKRRSSRWD